ncbi:Uma2 family endonuclease [Streptomyces niveiscabiei]|uniref:Uma2 family endonuclease n=1 Tax=Streptomyces niveiscabiei TaxID=164115 RepID=UPI0029AA85CE|nr:Uma2 family endonuclease [Streptomyces niveiscabiei]MDX3382172.1 Uma2 family endonuclease [Streptomyces niveiscabiei]
MVPLPVRRPHPGNLRKAAERIEASTGLRVEIIGGSLVMSPTPRGKHAGTVRRLRVQIESRLPAGLAPYQMSSIAMPEDPDDYATPDLTVLPVEWDEDDSWLADPADVGLAVEVISQSEKAKDITDKNGWYARAGVAVLLVLDPRTGRWTLHTRPKDGEYRGQVHGVYGETVELPAPLPSPVDTGVLPLYGS